MFKFLMLFLPDSEKMTRWAKNVRKHKPMDAASWSQLKAGVARRHNSSGSLLQEDASHSYTGGKRANKNKHDVNGFMDYLKHKRQQIPKGRQGITLEEQDVKEAVAIALKKDNRRENRRIKRQNATKSNMVCS